MTQKVNKMLAQGRRIRYIIPVLIIFSLLALISTVDWQANAQPPKQEKEDELPTVRVEEVGTLTTSQPEPILGVVRAKEAVTLVPRVSGYLTKVAFQEGTTVQKGDLLFEIEDTVYKMNVKVAESVVRQIEAEIELAKKDLERILTLHGDGVVSEQELDQAQRTINLQEAKLDEAKATLGLAENDLSYTKIYAPLTGRIGGKELSEGNYLTNTTGALATIVQYDPITILFTLSESKYIRYFIDAQAEGKQPNMEIFRTDGKPYQGEFKIDFADNTVDQDTRTIAIHLICSNAGDQLLPGGWCRVRLAERFLEPVPATEVAAVMTDGARHYVYIIASDNRIERRDVVLGEQVYNKYIIKAGLQPGEQVVVGGLNKVIPGDHVRTVSSKLDPTETVQWLPTEMKTPKNLLAEAVNK